MFSNLRLSASGGKTTKKAKTLITQTLNLRQQLESCHLYSKQYKHTNFNLLTFDARSLMCLPLEPNGGGQVHT